MPGPTLKMLPDFFGAPPRVRGCDARKDPPVIIDSMFSASCEPSSLPRPTRLSQHLGPSLSFKFVWQLDVGLPARCWCQHGRKTHVES